jgi:glycine cleavage system H lipoate-binding protein
MKCPYLRETRVQYCSAVASRKLFVRPGLHGDEGKCATPEWKKCSLSPRLDATSQFPSSCPDLHAGPAQYCAAVSVTKYLPCPEGILPPCGDDAYRYCELFLIHAHPEPGEGNGWRRREECRVHGIRVPGWLAYTHNHMWLDSGEGGATHIGVDALLASLLGSVDSVAFVTPGGFSRPAVVLAVSGLDLQMVYPGRMLVTRVNSSLRIHPERLTADPYGVGWLFEGATPEKDPPETSGGGLIGGHEAGRWMEDELQRLSAFVKSHPDSPSWKAARAGACGKSGLEGLLRRLGREEMLRLYNEFFAPQATWAH